MHNLVRNIDFVRDGIALPQDEFLSGIVSIFKKSSAILRDKEPGFYDASGDAAKRCKLALELAVLSLSEMRDLFLQDADLVINHLDEDVFNSIHVIISYSGSKGDSSVTEQALAILYAFAK